MEKAVTTAVRGRPREFSTEDALTAALRVFWSKGYEGASMSDLTEAMGVTRPSLYAAFGNKGSLFRQALDLYEREKLAYVSAALEAPTARGVAERLLYGALELQTSGQDPKGCLGLINSVACGTEAESIKAEVLKRRASSDGALRERMRRAKAEGDFPPHIGPDAMVAYLTAVLQGLCIQSGADASPEALLSVVETTLAFWPGR